MAPIGLFDSLRFQTRPTGSIELHCRWATTGVDTATALGELPPSETNLATRAIELLKRRAGITFGAIVHLVKRIPSAAGLGGGSSDAAAALLAANAGWDLGISRPELAELAAELGSDVPFFLGRGAAVCRGRGEKIEPVAGLGHMSLVVVRPPEGLSTAKVYAACRPAAKPRRVSPLLRALRSGNLRSLASDLHNRLEKPAAEISAWVSRLKAEFLAEGCIAAQMSGSGSACFGVCRHARHARRVASRLRAKKIGQVYAVCGG
jgi:4-diphosphocytidyl-2-C-methyl-D-erythritol kinase